MNHATVAVEIAAEINAGEVRPARVTKSARQGDLVLRRVGDADKSKMQPVPEGGIVLAVGSHGEHRLMAARAGLVDGVLHVLADSVVVHTDQPHARHRALCLTSGAWAVSGLRELDRAGLVQQVRD